MGWNRICRTGKAIYSLLVILGIILISGFVLFRIYMQRTLRARIRDASEYLPDTQEYSTSRYEPYYLDTSYTTMRDGGNSLENSNRLEQLNKLKSENKVSEELFNKAKTNLEDRE